MADEFHPGPVTDYGSSMVQWMRHRRPRYKGGAAVELERPSVSYVIDVCSINTDLVEMSMQYQASLRVHN